MGILERLFGKNRKSKKKGSPRKDLASTKCAFCGKTIIGEVKIRHHHWWCGECEGEFKSKKATRIKEELKEEKNLYDYWKGKIEQMRSNPSLLISELASDPSLNCENCGQPLLKKSDIWMDMDHIPPKIRTLMRSDTLDVEIGQDILNIATPYRAGKCTGCNTVYCFGCVQKKGKLLTEVARGCMKYSCIKCGNKISII